MANEEIRIRGLVAVLRKLGPVDYARFVRAFYEDQGDWTNERAQVLDGLTLDDWKKRLRDLHTST